MSTQTITISYTDPNSFADSYWIRIEQEVIDDAATVTEAADALDALYQIDACNQEEEETAEPVDPEEATEVIASAVSLPVCSMDSDGSIDTIIRIYKSHLSESYVLRLQGGTSVTTVQEIGSITVTKDISETVVLDYPVVSDFVCSPTPLWRNGNTIRFKSNQTGVLKATYKTQWDKVTVKISGVDGKPGECTVIAFYHGLVDKLDLKTPEISDIDRNLCPEHRWNFEPTNYDVTCYKDVVVTQRCSCSKQEVSYYTVQQVVPCPNQEMRCPNNETTCMHLLGTEAVDEWVECSGDNAVPGRPGEIYSLSTPAYYEEHCCKLPSVELPQCPVKRTVYKTDLPIEYGQAYWRELYGEATRFVPVAPPGGICGEWIVEQLIDSDNCCDGVPPLSWDQANSAETLSPSSSGTVRVTGGGRYDYEWTISGTGFSFASGATGITSVPYITVLTAASACGTATITCTDGCSSTTLYVRSTAGHWVRVYTSLGGLNGGTDGSAAYDGPAFQTVTCTGNIGTVGAIDHVSIQGGRKISQKIQGGSGEYRVRTYQQCIDECNDIAANPPISNKWLTGCIFDYPDLCMSCGECTLESSGNQWFNYQVGLHSTINYYFIPPARALQTVWFYVTLTLVWEWQC